jgi:hypothetical protein
MGMQKIHRFSTHLLIHLLHFVCFICFVLEFYCRLEKNEFLRRLFGAGEYEFYCICHVIQFNGTIYIFRIMCCTQ